MKILFIICALCFVLLACNGIRKDGVREFIPGAYYRHYMDQYTNSYDTIKIKLVTNGGSEGYVIDKTSHYQKMIDGQKTPFDYKIEKWLGRYDKNSKTLYIEKSGKRIYFDPEDRELKFGETPYKKLSL